MNLSYYIGVFWRRKWVIIATTLVTVGVVIFGLSRVPSAYLATATLRISTVASGSSDYLQFDLLYSDRLMRTYAQVATSRPLMESLVEQFDLSPDRLPKIETAIIEGTELLQLSVSSETQSLPEMRPISWRKRWLPILSRSPEVPNPLLTLQHHCHL
jgi:uncharacterized protein involved in exopolysaccharide biosynthesis